VIDGIRYYINGKSVTKEEWDAKKGVGLKSGEAPMGTVAYSESNPLPQDGAGVMKSQVAEARREIKKRNIQGVRVLDSGQLEVTSRRGRKEFLAMRNLHDNDGGYGD
jgi:hypothetical protein